MLFHFLFSAIILLLARTLPFAFRPRDFLISDVIAHSMIVRYGKSAPKSLLRAGQNYPVMIHYLLALLPIPMRAYVLVPFFMDLIFLAGLAMALSAMAAAGFIGYQPAILTLYLFPLYPAFVIQFYGPRSYGLNERIIGEVLFNLSVLLLIVWPSILTASLAALLLAISLLGSKFSIQATVLILLPAGVWLASPYILGALAAAFAVAVFAPGQNFSEKFKQQMKHLLWYTNYLKQPGCWAGARNKVPWPQAGESWKSYLWRLFRFITRDNAIFAGLCGHALLLFALFLTAGEWPGGGPLHAAIVFVIAGVASWLVTSFGVFKVLGEAERYLNYTAGPGFLVIAWALSRHMPSTSTLVILYAILAVLWLAVMIYLLWTKRRLDVRRQSLAPIVHWIKTREKPLRAISVLPTHEVWTLTSELLETFWWFNCFMRGDWKDMMFQYPYPKCAVIAAEQYDVVITRESILEELEEQDPCYGEIRKWPRLHQTGEYLIYAIPASRASRA